MKITEIETFQLGDVGRKSSTKWASNMIVVRVVTSSGIVGYGEAVPTLRNQSVIQSIKQVARFYLGKDPLNFEANRHEWHRHDFYLPISFESTTAASALDVACWDIAGRHFGATVSQLLGGSFRKSVRLYANGWYEGCSNPEQFAERAKAVAAAGYTALKLDPFGAYYDWIDEMGLKKARETVMAVRDATRGKLDILIEHHGRFNPTSAIMIAERLLDLDPLFMEEPIHPENLEGLKKYRLSVKARVALGERVLTKEQVVHLLANNLTDFLQPDITNVGGVTEARKICGLAEAFGVEVAFHNAFGPIQTAVTLQMDAAMPNFLIQESFYDLFPKWKLNLVKNQLKIEHGKAAVPSRPGIGVEIDERILARNKTEVEAGLDPDEPVWVVKDTWKA